MRVRPRSCIERVLLLSLSCLLLFTQTTRAATSQAAKQLLKDPPTDYSSAPLWVWSDDITPDQVVQSLRELAGQNIKMVFVHPRPGLIVPYLSEKWFDLWNATLMEAGRLGMKVWIYDENSYPSGFGGGTVPDAMPEARATGLHVDKTAEMPKPSEAIVESYRVEKESFLRVGASAAAATGAGSDVAGAAAYLTFKRVQASTTPWLAGKFYVDLMRPGVTKEFLRLTHDVYARHIGGHFGKLVPGVFTDEPNLAGAGGLPWTPTLPEVFKKRWGYDLLDHLPSLAVRVGDYRRVRHDYWRVVLDLFIENWSKPYHDWCEQHNLEWTGHYWEHEWPRANAVPDNMAMYAWHHRPSIDILFNQYSEDVNGQFGNTRAVKELGSVANQLGMKRTLCEAYGAAGWDLRFEDMKRIADWMCVLGVNTVDQHIADISIRGSRKHDHPQSFSYHEPWWADYHIQGSYLARLSAVISQGQQVNSVLLLEPTTTAWMYNTVALDDPLLMVVGKSFQELVQKLEMQQVEYDIGCEDIITRHGSSRGPEFVVGQRAYTTVILPPYTENIELRTAEMLERFIEQGGKVICAGSPPAYVDGRASDRMQNLASSPKWLKSEVNDVPALIERQVKTDVQIIRRSGDKGILFHQRRVLEDGQIVLFVNTSITDPSSGTLSAAASGIEQWDLQTGQPGAYAFERSGERVNAQYTLPPSGSLVLFLPLKERINPAPAAQDKVIKLDTDAPVARRLDPNVLTLDYVDLTVAGETKPNFSVLEAGNYVFQKHGLTGNPWDRSVQFKDELIRKQFAADSGFSMTYRFRIEGDVPEGLSFVTERADLYTITCNGTPIEFRKDQWWLDRSFGRLDISKAVKPGDNKVTLAARPLTMYHELDNAYVIGDFNLKAIDHGFVIVPATPLRLGAWSEQGLPLYGGAVSYTQHFEAADGPARYRVRLPKWYGSVARVLVNGQPAGHVAYAPWECDLTGKIKPGRNTLEIVVVGTLKNTLGPHHGKPPLGIAWPGGWDANPKNGPPPGSEYSIVGYGLFEPAVVERVGVESASK